MHDERSAYSSVVLVHGIFDTGRVFRKMSAALEANGFTTFVPDLSPNTGKSGLDTLARQLRDYVETHVPLTESCSLIGFSMGGLICRYYLQKLDGITRVDRFISLSAPHNGSRLAWFLSNRGSRQMRPESDFLNELNSGVQMLQDVETLSIWTPFDLSIIPARSSSIPVGSEIRIPVLLHPWMLSDRRCIDAVICELKKGKEGCTADLSVQRAASGDQ
jgi:triacylglycerol lipase